MMACPLPQTGPFFFGDGATMANADIRTVGAMRRVTRVGVRTVDEGEGEERLDRLGVVGGAGTREAGVTDALSTE